MCEILSTIVGDPDEAAFLSVTAADNCRRKILSGCLSFALGSRLLK
jgi:hypothetical protein